MKGNISINYLFDPDTIGDLEVWAFRFYFKLPLLFGRKKLLKAFEQLKSIEWVALRVNSNLDNPPILEKDRMAFVSIEVPADVRKRSDALELYESDVWKLLGNMAEHGFLEVYYGIDEERAETEQES